MSRWLRLIGSGGDEPPDTPRRPGGDRLLLRVAEARIRDIAEKLERGEAVPEDLRPLAIASLADAMTLARDAGEGSTKPRDQVRASGALAKAGAVVAKWLADEAGTRSDRGVVVAVNIIQAVPSIPAIIAGDGPTNGHEPQPRAALNGVVFRRSGGDGEGA